MAEPFNPSSIADVTAKRQAEFRRLVGDYKATFANEKGQRVLADLKQKFGFDRWEAESETLSDNIIARRVCMKGALYHIQKMLAHTFRKEPKPRRALSDHHHENTSPPSSSA